MREESFFCFIIFGVLLYESGVFLDALPPTISASIDTPLSFDWRVI